MAGREYAGQVQLAGQKIDRHRQLGGRQNLLANRFQQVLRGHVLLGAFAEHAEKIGLLDVLLTIQHQYPCGFAATPGQNASRPVGSGVCPSIYNKLSRSRRGPFRR